MITSRLHRTGPTTIDLDFKITPTLTVTLTFQTHGAASQAQMVFINLENDEQKLTYIRGILTEQGVIE